MSTTRHTDSKGRLTLGPAYADRDVTVVHEGARLIIEPVVLIPESEAWLYRNARAKNLIRSGLGDAQDGRLVSPDLADAFGLADSIPDE